MTDENRTGKAVALVMFAMAWFGLIDNFIRLAAETGGLWQFHLMRGAVAIAALVPYARLRGIRLRPRRPAAVAFRTLCNATSMLIYFGCLGFMPIAQVAAGLYTSPIFVVLFSVFLFRERVGPRRLFAVAIGFAGIVLALGLDSLRIDAWSVLPVLSGAAYAMGNIATRRWCRAETTETLLGAFFVVMGVMGAAGMIFLAVHPLPVAPGGDGFLARGFVVPDRTFWIVVIAQALGSLLGVGASIRAYVLAEPTLVAVLENTLLVFATIWAFLLWNQIPTLTEGIGLALVLAAGIIIALRNPSPRPAAPDTFPE